MQFPMEIKSTSCLNNLYKGWKKGEKTLKKNYDWLKKVLISQLTKLNFWSIWLFQHVLQSISLD